MSLEDEFHERMMELYRRCVAHTYHAHGFRSTVERMGGVAAAKYWLNQPKEPGDGNQTGLDRLSRMAMNGSWPTALEESMEYVVGYERRWRPLFTHLERQEARRRYEAYKGLGGIGKGKAA